MLEGRVLVHYFPPVYFFTLYGIFSSLDVVVSSHGAIPRRPLSHYHICMRILMIGLPSFLSPGRLLSIGEVVACSSGMSNLMASSLYDPEALLLLLL
jgi:hypothetical protein